MIGRENERAAVGEFLTELAAPGALVLEGEAGIGKTTLWHCGVRQARAAGLQVLRCHPAAAETRLSFGAVADLLAEVPEDAHADLPAPQRRALDVALLREEAGDQPPDPRAIAGALLGVLGHLSESAPVVLAIDDLQWLDAPSRAVLEFAIRRLDEEPVVVLGTRRGEPGEMLELGLDRAFAPGRVQRIALAGFTMGALHQLLRQELDLSLSRPVLRRVRDISGGNPFYALEIGRTLERRGTLPRPDELLPVPPTLKGMVKERVGALPERTRELLVCVQALADRRVAVVRRLAAESGLEGVLDEAIAAGLLVVDGARVEFAHPLFAAGVLSTVGPEERRALHARLALVETADEAAALHLALANDSPDAGVAERLSAAAARAFDRGAAESASRLAGHAIRLTPVVDGSDEVGWRTTKAVGYHIAAGDVDYAEALLVDLVATIGPGSLRANALSLLSWIGNEGKAFERSVAMGHQALEEADPADARLIATIHLRLAVIERIRGNLAASVNHARAAVREAERSGSPTRLAVALGDLGRAQMLRGAGVTPELRRAVALERDLPHFIGQSSPLRALGLTLTYGGYFDEARAALNEVYDRARAAGRDDTRAHLMSNLAEVERRAGDWERARVLSDGARELSAQVSSDQEYSVYQIVGALLDAQMGRVDEARATADAGLATAERIGDATAAVHYRGILGFVELSLGRHEAAAGFLAPASDSLLRQGIGELSIYPVFENEIDALVQLGQIERAERLVAHLELLAERTGAAWTRGMAARGRGLLLAHVPDLEGARASLLDAVAAQEDGAPFELARTFVVLGAVERRMKQRAAGRASLDRAVEIFARLGAPLWVATARAELARMGERRGPDQLSETEERVAELAAAGRTNPEIAAALFISPKTVEANLTRVYRKLGVRSRIELALRTSDDS